MGIRKEKRESAQRCWSKVNLKITTSSVELKNPRMHLRNNREQSSSAKERQQAPTQQEQK
jgi:hypothetical protein